MRVENFLLNFRNTRWDKIVSLLVILVLLVGILAGCAVDEPADAVPGEPGAPGAPGAPGEPGAPGVPGEIIESHEEYFDQFIDELFVEFVTSDTISLNFALADPSAFGIEGITPTFGDVPNYELARENWERSIASQQRLRTFDFSQLRPDQQIIYNILTRSFELSHSLELQEDHVFYTGIVRPLNGLQIMLPILLTEFNFRSVEDFDIFFELLEDAPRFFSDIIEFERERSRRGFFLSVENVDKVLAHLDSFLANREDNFLLVIINDKIDDFEGLTEEQREEFRQRNEELILNTFLPAYDSLASAIRELRGVGALEGSIANLPDGVEFARIFAQHRADSDMTLAQMQSALAGEFDRVQLRLHTLFSENPHLLDLFLVGMLGNIPFDSPENYMIILEEAIAQDFPRIEGLNFSVIEVHESIQEHVGPAFFIIPPVDDFMYNSIYVNPSRIDDNLFLFTIMAHEGLPGHMYKYAYFFTHSLHPIRNRLTGLGYTEGWASYVEYMSYFWAGLDEAEAEIMSLSRQINLLFSSILDLNINAFGWDIDQVGEFLHANGMALGEDVVVEIFHDMTANPFQPLPYTIGYIEFRSLLSEAQNLLGDDFSLLDFHTFFLDFGPAPFSLLREHLPIYFQSNQVTAAR